ncbi:MAG: alanine:cation symporter family protein [Saprospiraceae bacterium]|nr:alanine:cation symporter family protein [Saprospiraceae bacterium]
MKKVLLLAAISFLVPTVILANSIDETIESYMGPVTRFIEATVFFTVPIGDFDVPFVIIWLIVGATFFTVYNNFINIIGFKHALDVVRGQYDKPGSKGEVSHFQALATALSGTVGVGNIAGVAVAVATGGAGATFWMILAGLLGMSSKFVECTLGLKYRKVNADGSVSGGPMYYLSQGLEKRGWKSFGKVLAIIFAIACVGGSFGGGNMLQINQATQQLAAVTGGENSIFNGNGWTFGVFMAIVVGLVILGGIKSIAKVTDKLVPLMVGIYLGAGLIVLGYHFMDIPKAFMMIMEGAFTKNAAFGGFLGVLLMGFRRAAFSNEAGVGSASIAHAAAKTDNPIDEGIVALLEPFIDTVVICTMTALVIIITGNAPDTRMEISGNIAIGLTSKSFTTVMPWFPPVLSVAVILFALSTMISWSYYGLKAWTYLFGETKAMDYTYKLIYCGFIIIGSAISATSVFNLGDAMIFAMCFPNVLGLYFLAPEVRRDLKEYFAKNKKVVK